MCSEAQKVMHTTRDRMQLAAINSTPVHPRRQLFVHDEADSPCLPGLVGQPARSVDLLYVAQSRINTLGKRVPYSRKTHAQFRPDGYCGTYMKLLQANLMYINDLEQAVMSPETRSLGTQPMLHACQLFLGHAPLMSRGCCISKLLQLS